MNNHKLPLSKLIERLEPPTGKVRMVLDTDTFNEIDDQFALVQALLSPERLQVEAIYAAPFTNDRSTGPEDGMKKSYEEILQLLGRLGRNPEGWVFTGSPTYLPNGTTPVRSDAALDLVQRAMASPDDDPLYVVAIGAITNVASAILLEPAILSKIVVVWLGGNALHWPSAHEFNLMQDYHASNLIVDCGVPLVLVPCQGVVTHLLTTTSEMELYVKGCGDIGDFLYQRFYEYTDDHYGYSKVIWDMAAVACLLEPSMVSSTLVHSPILSEDLRWSTDSSRHFIRYVHKLNRDIIFRDFFKKLKDFSSK